MTRIRTNVLHFKVRGAFRLVLLGICDTLDHNSRSRGCDRRANERGLDCERRTDKRAAVVSETLIG